MLTDIRRTLEKFKEELYEMQTDLSIMIDDAQEASDRVPKDSEEYDTAWEIVSALKDATISLEEAMDNIQTAIDESEEIEWAN